MDDRNWTASLSEDERQVVIGCLCHTLEDFDAPCLDGRHQQAEVMLRELDAHINDPGLEPTTFVGKLPDEVRPALWASMWATIRDIHAPQDNLRESDWRSLEDILRLIDEGAAPEGAPPSSP